MTEQASPNQPRSTGIADEGGLLSRLRAGDTAALDQLLKAYWPSLVRYATALLKDPDTAQDLVQDTFVRLWDRRSRLEPGSLRAYCYRVLHNLAMDEIRRRRFRIAWSLKLNDEPETNRGSAETDLLRQEREAAVSRAIDALPTRRRETFILAHLHGLSYQEIATVMGVSPATVKNQVAAALAQLRSALRSHLE